MREWMIATHREALADMVADLMARQLSTAIRTQGKASLAAAGGESPEPLYRALSHHPIAWTRVTVAPVDERWVPEDDAASNARRLRAWLMQDHAAAAYLLSLKTPDADPAEAVMLVEEQLREQIPAPTVLLLGMGEDGHVGSLFPHQEALSVGLDPEQVAWCVAATDPKGQPRLSTTLSWWLQASHIVLWAPGPAKRAVLEQAMTGAEAFDFPAMPVRAVLFQDSVPVTLCVCD